MAKQTLGSVFVGVGVTLAATLAVVMGCGGGSGATRPVSTGGTTGTGTGGTTGTGGAGGATSAGTGGTSSTATLNCSPGVNPASPMLTTFTSSGTTPDWNNVSGKWGTTGNLTGSVYAYQGSKSGTSAFKASVDTTAGVLNIGTAAGTGVTGGMIAAGDYAGGGLSFSQCVNTTTYTGVTFTLSGTAGGCDVYFQAQTFDEQGASNGGGCPSTASCYSFPQLKVVSAPADPTGTAITVKFTDLMGGEPDAGAAIAMQLVGLQFQLQSTSPVGDAAQTGCSNVELTIDNVAFTE